MIRRTNTPYWITTNYGGQCNSCRLGIKKGETALYYPATKKLLCARETCGQKVEREAQEAKERRKDELLYGVAKLHTYNALSLVSY